MSHNIQGKVAVVTGSSRGIGRACARALSDAGARIALVSRSPDTLADTKQEIPGAELTVAADLAFEGSAQRVAEQVLHHFDGEVHVLINNAGAVLNRRTVRLRETDVDALLNLNVRAALMLSSALVPPMLEGGAGSIVNVGSINGMVGLPFSAAYAAPKSAIDGLTRACAAEWGPFGVRVNSVCPGVIDTDMWTDGRRQPGVDEHVTQQVALRRWGTPDDVAEVVLFLASDAARYVTAQILAVDGGLANTRDLLPRPDIAKPEALAGQGS